MDRQRKIVHIDMDAFYAAVEQRDHPAYRDRPIVVGGSPESRGVVATCSYEARRFGIRSAMPASQAARLCPQAIFVRPRFEVYRQVSAQIQALFGEYTALVEPLSLDEAYLDVTGVTEHHGSASLIARDIKRRIRELTGLSASAGVSYNKFLAKLASDMDKPDGFCLIRPEQGAELVATLPIGRFHGIGPATEKRMHEHGIRTGAELREWTLERLQAVFGKAARYYYQAARGIDERPVSSQRLRQSLGSETTFPQDLHRVEDMLQALEQLAVDVAQGMAQRHLAAHTLTIKVKYADFRLVTRSLTRPVPMRDLNELRAHLAPLLARTDAGQRPVRLLGVTVSGLTDADSFCQQPQLELFEEAEPRSRSRHNTGSELRSAPRLRR